MHRKTAGTMQSAPGWFLVLGGLAAALLAATPSATAAAASAELPKGTLRCDSGSVLVHVVRAGDTLHQLAVSYRQQAGWYSQADLLSAIRRQNTMADERRLRIGQKLTIPVYREQAPPRVVRPVRDGTDLRGIYLPAPMCGYQSVFARIDSFTARGGNGVVFDAKDIDGKVSFRSGQKLASFGEGRLAPVIGDLADLVRRLHDRGLWVVARLAIFLDGELGTLRPDLALRGPGGEPWTERGCVWLDPVLPEVRAYNIGLAVELAQAGVDEVQLDYVRFPTNGWRGDFTHDLASIAARRREVITGFVAAVHDTLRCMGCLLSADLFGIMAWDRPEDLALTGQHIGDLASHLDVICPMIYPSHFEPGFEGRTRPADHPDYFIAEGVRRFRAQAGDRVPVRPWLQAFPWRVARYDAEYVLAQILAAQDAGAGGWCLWNPSGRYEPILDALFEIEYHPPDLTREYALWQGVDLLQ
jgi:hypothetical protein